MCIIVREPAAAFIAAVGYRGGGRGGGSGKQGRNRSSRVLPGFPESDCIYKTEVIMLATYVVAITQ